MDPSALLVLTRRIRWRNLARVGAVAALGLLVLAWPRLSSTPVAVPAAGAVPVVRGPVGRVQVAPAPGTAPRATPAGAPASPPAHPAPRAVKRRPTRRPHKRSRPRKRSTRRPVPAPATRPAPVPTAAPPAPRARSTPPPAPSHHPTREFGPAGGDF